MEWIIKKQSLPTQISSFMNNVFMICEVRGRVGKVNGISFIVHSNEANHTIPHVHARYNGYEISISISDEPEVIIGNIPKKQQKIAVDWVKTNKENLITDWNDIAFSANTSLTKSMLELD